MMMANEDERINKIKKSLIHKNNLHDGGSITFNLTVTINDHKMGIRQVRLSRQIEAMTDLYMIDGITVPVDSIIYLRNYLQSFTPIFRYDHMDKLFSFSSEERLKLAMSYYHPLLLSIWQKSRLQLKDDGDMDGDMMKDKVDEISLEKSLEKLKKAEQIYKFHKNNLLSYQNRNYKHHIQKTAEELDELEREQMSKKDDFITDEEMEVIGNGSYSETLVHDTDFENFLDSVSRIQRRRKMIQELSQEIRQHEQKIEVMQLDDYEELSKKSMEVHREINSIKTDMIDDKINLSQCSDSLQLTKSRLMAALFIHQNSGKTPNTLMHIIHKELKYFLETRKEFQEDVDKMKESLLTIDNDKSNIFLQLESLVENCDHWKKVREINELKNDINTMEEKLLDLKINKARKPNEAITILKLLKDNFLEMPDDMKVAYWGYKNIYNLVEDWKESEWKEKRDLCFKYYGTLVDNIFVDPSLYLAVEAALGTRLFTHLVESRKISIKIIKEMKKKNLPGSYIFCILNDVEISERDSKTKGLTMMYPDVINKFRSHILKAVEYLFSDIILCQTLEEAVDKSQKYGMTCVTMGGEKVTETGVITIGPQAPTMQLLDKINELNDRSSENTLDNEIESLISETSKKRQAANLLNHQNEVECSFRLKKMKFYQKKLRELEDAEVEMETQVRKVSSYCVAMLDRVNFLKKFHLRVKCGAGPGSHKQNYGFNFDNIELNKTITKLKMRKDHLKQILFTKTGKLNNLAVKYEFLQIKLSSIDNKIEDYLEIKRNELKKLNEQLQENIVQVEELGEQLLKKNEEKIQFKKFDKEMIGNHIDYKMRENKIAFLKKIQQLYRDKLENAEQAEENESDAETETTDYNQLHSYKLMEEAKKKFEKCREQYNTMKELHNLQDLKNKISPDTFTEVFSMLNYRIATSIPDFAAKANEIFERFIPGGKIYVKYGTLTEENIDDLSGIKIMVSLNGRKSSAVNLSSLDERNKSAVYTSFLLALNPITNPVISDNLGWSMSEEMRSALNDLVKEKWADNQLINQCERPETQDLQVLPGSSHFIY